MFNTLGAGGNTTAIHFDHSPSTNGIFEDAQGKVAALRLCYMFQHDGKRMWTPFWRETRAYAMSAL